MKKKLLSRFILTLSLLAVSACDREWTSPYEANYKLSPPTLLSVEPFTDTSIRITWKNSEDFAKVVILKKVDSGEYSEIGIVDVNIKTFIDSTCELGAEYTYLIRNKIETNLSANSNMLPGATIFPAPSALVVNNISDSEVQVAWVDNCSFEVGYFIERMGDSGFTGVGVVLSDVTEFTDTGLIYGQSYAYRVAAYTPANTSSWATITAVTEFPAPSDLLATSVNDIGIQLTWTDNTDYETGFKIERDSGGGFSEIAMVSTNVTEFTDDGLNSGQLFTYRVAAYTSANMSSWATITAATGFPAPSDLSAIGVSDSEIRLSWTDNTGYEIGFNIERDEGSGFTEVGTVSADVTEYTDTGMTLGQSYDYRVAAFSSTNTSSWATISAATEFAGPSSLSAIGVSDSEIQLTWTDNTDFETGFAVERDGGSGFTEVGTVSADVTEYLDTGLSFGQSYTYRVTAFTAGNQSDYSVTAIARAIAPLLDYDGNIYETIHIGDQVWMAENLKVTHYRDGTSITLVTDNTAWPNLSSEAYCIYNNNSSNELDTYGALYNWYAANGDVDGDGVKDKEIAPEGWHVPTDEDWKELEIALGMSQSELDNILNRGTNEGSKLAGNADLWISGALKNDSEFGTSGFTALPGGSRNIANGDYSSMGTNCLIWSATEDFSNSYHYYRRLTYSNSGIERMWGSLGSGYSVRLVRD